MYKPENLTLNTDSATYLLDTIAPVQGLYKGTFKFKLSMTPIMEINSDREYRSLLGNPTNTDMIPIKVLNMAFIISQLKYRILESPPFWQMTDDGKNIEDYSILEELLEASIEAQKQHSTMLNEKHAKSLKRLEKKIDEKQKEKQINKELDEL